ncbi:MAG: alpha/beta fold hydrolase [Symploca sp. SIO3E6]|nr:alpha/beta fold hydrolase [Caldora sp. SIO3E6]
MVEKRMFAEKFYTWKDFRCAYEVYATNQSHPPLLLIHPIGVGLSRLFWRRFGDAWLKTSQPNPIYNPDLLGCGANAQPRFAYYPEDWAQQLHYFIQEIVKTPVIVVCQGALLPVAITLTDIAPHLIKGLVLAGPPTWQLLSEDKTSFNQRLAWNLFDSPLGTYFYRYARRRQFLQSFSVKQLFAKAVDVDEQWLNTLQAGAKNLESRYAVFSFLSGFWRQDYSAMIAKINQPTFVVLGEQASSISRDVEIETPKQRLESYLKGFTNCQGTIIPGRNVLPYESTQDFVSVLSDILRKEDWV